jgi:hypothetical protein
VVRGPFGTEWSVAVRDFTSVLLDELFDCPSLCVRHRIIGQQILGANCEGVDINERF